MADHSKIEWTDATWTPIKGCTRVSPGCGGPGPYGGCYAEIMAARFSKPGQWGEGLAEIVTLPDGRKDHRWTGRVRFDQAELLKPLKWKRPRKIFVCSTADLFHEKVEDAWIDRIFAVMALCPQHTFQVLTKRSARMRAYIDDLRERGMSRSLALSLAPYKGQLPISYNAIERALGLAAKLSGDQQTPRFPLENVWLGVSVEDRQRMLERGPDLAATPAVVHFWSAEPLLGDLGEIDPAIMPEWMIVGGESGPGARPMHPDWARSLRDQCAAAGVPFFFKQWGEWAPSGEPSVDVGRYSLEEVRWCECEQRWSGSITDDEVTLPDTMNRVGKKAAGRLLDGTEYNGVPA